MVALNQMSLTHFRGWLFGPLGSNGEGKFTLIKILDGLIKETSGTVIDLPPKKLDS
jgi:ABC-2 type transport system ATP-binding protein